MEGYTEIVKLAESALNGDSEKSKFWINKFIDKHPNSELIKPFKALLIGDKNPDKLKCEGENSDELSNCNKPLVSNLAKFKELVEKQKDIDPEILQAVNELYWDLIQLVANS